MSEGLGWLPIDLHSVAMRIARADECAYAIGEIAALWSFQGPLDLEQVRCGNHVTIRVRDIRPIPPLISLLFSEAVNHLRAALDNVIWYLVEAYQGAVTGRAAQKVNLPIYDDEAKLDRWREDRVKAGLTAFAPATTVYQRIRRLQPFVDQRSVIPNVESVVAAYTGAYLEQAHPLKLLQGYSNDDKHRAIRVAVSRTRGGSVDQPLVEPLPFVELKVGDIVAEGIWGDAMAMEMASSIQIPRPAPYTALVSPANEVSRLTVYVAHTAVPELITGLTLTGSLPMKVNLDDSGLTDHQRLTDGDRQPAQERLRPWIDAKYLEALSQPVRFPTLVEDR